LFVFGLSNESRIPVDVDGSLIEAELSGSGEGEESLKTSTSELLVLERSSIIIGL